MILVRHLGARMLGWMLLALALLLGFATLAGVVEGVRHGASTALLLGLYEAPVLVLPLVPLASATGAALAAAQLRARGEAVALQAMGVPPARTAAIALLAGTLLGGAGAAAHALVVPAAAAQALALRHALGEGLPDAGWLWTGDAAVRLADGTRVSVGEGRIREIAPGPPPDADLLRRARAQASPAVATLADLRDGDARPLRVEAWQRALRPLAAGLLAALAWLGLGQRRGPDLAFGLALALGWQAVALALETQAAQGLLPLSAGGLGPLLALVLVGAALHGPPWRRRSVRPAAR